MIRCPIHQVPARDCPECWEADTEELDTRDLADMVPYVDASDEPTMPATPESHHARNPKR